MKTAAAYIRVSTDMQTEYSPDSQLKLIQDYADKNGILLLQEHIYEEDGGKSGKSMAKRERFLEMISAAKQNPKPFDVILVWKFSRFARNQEEAIVLKSMLKRNEIEVVSISEPLPEGAFGDLVERIIEWTDSYYLVNLSGEVKRGMLEKFSRGEPVCPPPIGYDMKDKKYIPNTDAPFVRQVYTDYMSGMGMRAIAEKYGKLGLRTTRGNMPDNRFIEYMLRNPVYCGKLRWSSDGRAASKRKYDDEHVLIVQGNHEPLISEETFSKVQDKLDETKKMYGKYQRREQPVDYMLKGLVRCNTCGATLTLQSALNTPSLQCHNYARGNCNVSHSISLKKAEQAVIEYLQQAAISGIFNVAEKNDSIYNEQEKDLQKILSNERLRLERIKQAYQDGIDTLDEYKINKTAVLASISKLEKAIEKQKKAGTKGTDLSKKKAIIQNKISKALKVITNEHLPASSKNEALRSVIQTITYHKPSSTLEVLFRE